MTEDHEPMSATAMNEMLDAAEAGLLRDAPSLVRVPWDRSASGRG